MVTAVKVTAVSMVSIEQSSDGDNGDPGTTVELPVSNKCSMGELG